MFSIIVVVIGKGLVMILIIVKVKFMRIVVSDRRIRMKI